MLKEKLNELVNLCKRIGLRDSDYSAIISLINNGEYKVAIEWLIDQLYEYEINIPSELCSEIKRKANEMGVSNDRAKLLDELSSSARGTKHT